MKTIHQALSRGQANHGWLKSFHTFSFGSYYNSERMGFGALRVINDDQVIPGAGFGTHPHKDMEIISVPLSGSLSHRDSVGNSSIIQRGEIQIMSAGTGITHSEFNPSTKEAVNFLQIWVLPKKLGIQPRYEQRTFSAEERKNRFQLIVAPDGREGALTINQDAFFSLVTLETGKSLTYHNHYKTNGVYIFLIQGDLVASGERLLDRDGLSCSGIQSMTFSARAESEFLVMEVPV
jgi:redox-sensitive bicupin YhaK (pirin superfamily)